MSDEQTDALINIGPETKMVVVSQGRPAYPIRAKEAFGVDVAGWRALVDSVWPSARTPEGVILALSYCKARNLDPFKRPVHIVPVYDSKRGMEIETVWPGIAELRTTAFRTGQYAGCDDVAFGPEVTRAFKGMVGKRDNQKLIEKTVTFPEWAQMTVYRLVGGIRVPFKGPAVRWLESYAAIGASDVPNDIWAERPYGQNEKCAEAAALRRAFPEEIGNEYSAEEMQGRRVIDLAPEMTLGGNDIPTQPVTVADIRGKAPQPDIARTRLPDPIAPPAAQEAPRRPHPDVLLGAGLAAAFPGLASNGESVVPLSPESKTPPASPFPSRRRREPGPVRGSEYLEALVGLGTHSREEIEAKSQELYLKLWDRLSDTEWKALSDWAKGEIEKAEG